MTTVYDAIVRTPFGRDLYVACTDDGVIESRFVARARAGTRTAGVAASRARRARTLCDAVAELEAYFGRRAPRFTVPLVTTGTPLQRAVWEAVAALPVGMLASYADVARAVGRPHAHRGVASALAKSPLAVFIPAHRVVGADGRIRGAAPNSMRRRLLAFEGIAIR